MFLAGDIGGTKTDLALFTNEGKMVKEKKFLSINHSSLQEICDLFLAGEKAPLLGASFGVAGPILDGKASLTNLAWTIDVSLLKKALKIEKISLINDVEASAYGILELKEKDFFVLHQGEKEKGNQAFISIGTGLGESCLFWDGKNFTPFATEGGHADFAARNSLEIELFHYVKEKYGHVSYERILSGYGIVDLYLFFTERKKMPKVENSLIEGKKEIFPSLITTLALEKKSSTCEKVVDLFLSILGAEAGNLALKMMAKGGVVLGGGIIPKILALLREEIFLENFLAKGRFSSLLKTFPIKVVLEEKVALYGAFAYAKK
jgi:glucokinase